MKYTKFRRHRNSACTILLYNITTVVLWIVVPSCGQYVPEQELAVELVENGLPVAVARVSHGGEVHSALGQHRLLTTDRKKHTQTHQKNNIYLKYTGVYTYIYRYLYSRVSHHSSRSSRRPSSEVPVDYPVVSFRCDGTTPPSWKNRNRAPLTAGGGNRKIYIYEKMIQEKMIQEKMIPKQIIQQQKIMQQKKQWKKTWHKTYHGIYIEK